MAGETLGESEEARTVRGAFLPPLLSPLLEEEGTTTGRRDMEGYSGRSERVVP